MWSDVWRMCLCHIWNVEKWIMTLQRFLDFTILDLLQKYFQIQLNKKEKEKLPLLQRVKNISSSVCSRG